MIERIYRSHRLRNRLSGLGYNEESVEMYVVIDEASDAGSNYAGLFENKTLCTIAKLAVLKMMPGLQPHIGNIERLYDDPAYRSEWIENYQSGLEEGLF